ncbi:insulin-like growth factor-like 3 [Microplitis demolitor]|nr:insulin-like growth factor-like 3 [Microplitis demolitor]
MIGVNKYYCILITLMVAVAVIEMKSIPNYRVQICGRRLSDFLDQICNLQIIVETSNLVLDDVSKKKTVYNGIADECCDHTCSIFDLLEYCP